MFVLATVGRGDEICEIADLSLVRYSPCRSLNEYRVYGVVIQLFIVLFNIVRRLTLGMYTFYHRTTSDEFIIVSIVKIEELTIRFLTIEATGQDVNIN